MYFGLKFAILNGTIYFMDEYLNSFILMFFTFY